MKTIQSNSAQKANMRSSRKSNKTTTTPSNENESSTGKKLVQARLPFKIIAGTPSVKPQDDGTPSGDNKEIPSKKRKLSFTEESDTSNKIGKSEIKENLTNISQLESAASTIDVIVLQDDDVSEEELQTESKSPKTPITTETSSQKKKIKATNNASSNNSSTTPKLQIKLPMSGKKKRKSKRVSRSNAKDAGSDSSDVELVSGELENPHKKQKFDELSIKKVQNEKSTKPVISSKDLAKDESKKETVSEENKNTKVSSLSNTPSVNEVSSKEKEKQNNIPAELEAQTPKTSKPTRSSTKKLQSPSVKPSETNPQQEKKLSKQSKGTPTSRISQALEKSSSKTEVLKDSSAKKLTNSTSLKSEESPRSQGDTSAKKKLPIDTPPKPVAKDTTPVTETRSRRSNITTSETEKHNTDDESSEPEFVSENTNPADVSLSKVTQIKVLTPKQQKLMEQRKKAREEKELKLQQQKEERERKLQEQREEKERKFQEEKLQKQKEREERELLRKKEREEKEDQKRREKEEKEDQRRKEKEDKERKRLAEIEAKNEEKRKKDEAKEEERRKKELQKEEEENKKKKAAQAFTKFFVSKPVKPIAVEDPESRDDAESVDSLAFRPFQVKGDMKLAPLVRREFKERSREKLDSFLKTIETKNSVLYIDELKNGEHIPLRGSKTVLKNNYEDDDDVIVVVSELENAAQTIDEARTKPIQKYRAKYYNFRENRRPPFYGTWRKKSTLITPRRPFATDKKFFDYEIDSDEEWEEEEPGESLNGSEDEKDESEDEDYEVDNEWFVPHGHLSDEELQNEDELGPDTSREAQKAKLKALQQEFAQEMKKKTEKIKPRLIGAIWEDENGNRPKLCPTIIWDSLCTRAMIFCESPLIEAPEIAESEPNTPPPEKQKRIEIKDGLLKDLVRLVHGNRHSRVFLIKEYMEHVSNTCDTVKSGEYLAPTKSQIKEKIDEISEWSVVNVVNKKKKNKKKLCWIVTANVLQTHELGNLSLRNEWSYKLQPRYDKDKNDQNTCNETEDEIHKPQDSEQMKTDTIEKTIETEKTGKIEKIKPKHPVITKFTKVITKEEKKNQQVSAPLKAPSKGSPNISNASTKVKETQNSTTPAFKKPVNSTTVTAIKNNKNPVVKKRVALLMSVPTGQQFSPQSKNALISKFLQNNKTKSIEVEKSSKVPSNTVTKMDVDEVVVLD